MKNIKMRYSIEPRNLKNNRIQKTAEATGDLIGNKIADKITSVSKKKPAKELPNDETEEDVEIATPKQRYISPEKKNKLLKN